MHAVGAVLLIIDKDNMVWQGFNTERSTFD